MKVRGGICVRKEGRVIVSSGEYMSHGIHLDLTHNFVSRTRSRHVDHSLLISCVLTFFFPPSVTPRRWLGLTWAFFSVRLYICINTYIYIYMKHWVRSRVCLKLYIDSMHTLQTQFTCLHTIFTHTLLPRYSLCFPNWHHYYKTHSTGPFVLTLLLRFSLCFRLTKNFFLHVCCVCVCVVFVCVLGV